MMSESDERRQQIKFKAVAALAAKERSRLGLFKKLSDQFEEPGDAELINSVLEELEKRKYLSDERFAKSQVMIKNSRFGDQKLRWELRRQGVSSELADEAIRENEVSELDRARVLWERRFGEPPQDPKERARQVRFLAYRGFSFRTIEKVLRCRLDEEE